MIGARWYRAACTAHFRGRSAGFVTRSDGAGLGAAERFDIEASEARLESVDALDAPPALTSEGAGGLGAPFRSGGVTVWIGATGEGGDTEWLEARVETLWIADWEVLDSVRDEGRIAGRLRGTAYIEVTDEAPPREPPLERPAAVPAGKASSVRDATAPAQPTEAHVLPPTAPSTWDVARAAPAVSSGAVDPWRAMEGVDFGLGRVRGGRRSGCAWLGGGAGMGALLLGGCCLIGPIFQAIAGIGVGGGTLLGVVVAALVALGLSALAWRLWRRDATASRSGCGPRVLAILLLVWLLGGCLAAAMIGMTWFGRGVPRVAAPLLGGLDLGCWQTGIGYRDRAGERIRVTCPGSCALHRVWGTDVYTDDSSICAAAQHAGLVAGRRTAVTIRVREGRDVYVGSSRHGVESNAWARWGGSFSFCGGPTPETRCDDAPPRSVSAPPSRAPSHRTRVSLSVSVDPHAEGGASWDVANGLPDLAVCVTTDARRCVPADRHDRPGVVQRCHDALRCQVHVPIDPKARTLHVEVIDRDPAENDRVGEGDCEFGGSCRVGRALVTVGPGPAMDVP